LSLTAALGGARVITATAVTAGRAAAIATARRAAAIATARGTAAITTAARRGAAATAARRGATTAIATSRRGTSASTALGFHIDAVPGNLLAGCAERLSVVTRRFEPDETEHGTFATEEVVDGSDLSEEGLDIFIARTADTADEDLVGVATTATTTGSATSAATRCTLGLNAHGCAVELLAVVGEGFIEVSLVLEANETEDIVARVLRPDVGDATDAVEVILDIALLRATRQATDGNLLILGATGHDFSLYS
jgi:hypothetical protein